MAISIKSERAEKLVRKVSSLTGEGLTEAVVHSLQERLDRLQRVRSDAGLAQQLDAIAQRCAALPTEDTRSENEILDYDASGIPRNGN